MKKIRANQAAWAVVLPALPALALAQETSVRGSDIAPLEEVVVTVQRRADRLIDVPIAVASASAADLSEAGVIGLFDLNTVMPGVRIDHYGAYSQPTIRGQDPGSRSPSQTRWSPIR